MAIGFPDNIQAKQRGGNVDDLKNVKVIIQTEHGDIEIKFFSGDRSESCEELCKAR